MAHVKSTNYIAVKSHAHGQLFTVGSCFAALVEISSSGGVQQQKRSCRREKPKMSFVFFVLFLFFFKTRSKSTFLCLIWSKMCPQKRTKKIMIFVFLIFYVLFCCFFRIWLKKCPQTENKKEQKRSCRRENRKMSFVFFVVGPPPHHDIFVFSSAVHSLF